MSSSTQHTGDAPEADDRHSTNEGAFQPTPTITFIALALVILGVSIFICRQFAPLFQQLLMAVFILYLIAPAHNWLQRQRVPKFVSYGLILTVAVLIFTAVGYLITESFAELEFDPEEYRPKLFRLIDDTAARLSFVDAEKLKSSLADNDSRLWEQGRQWLQSSVGTAFSIGGQIIMVGIFLIFLIVEQGSLTERLKRGFGEEQAKTYLKAIERINTAISKYVAVKTFCSLLIGGATTIILLLFGVDGAYLWGFLAFLLNYIPYIGPVIAATIPGLFAVVHLQNPWMGIVVLVLLHLGQGVVGNVLDPMLLGRSLNISPTMTLVFMVLWGSLWGVTGMIISVPLLVTTQIILENFDATKPLAVLLKRSA